MTVRQVFGEKAMVASSDIKVCSSCVLNSTFPGITFDENGVCSVCTHYVEKHLTPVDQKAGIEAKRKALDQLCADARAQNRTFDVLVPLSGGKDSMYVLYLAVKELGLKPLAFTLDNGYLTQLARDNIDRACRILGVEHVYYCMDPQLMNQLYGLFMRKTGYFCSICMRAIGMATEVVAEMYDIPLVFSGSAAKVELPTAPEMFQPGCPHFAANVLKDEPIEYECKRLLYKGSIKRRLGYHLFWWGSQRRLKLCAWLNLPDYIEWHYETMYKTIREKLEWQTPSGKEEEHIDCGLHKISAYIHNRRWKGSEIQRLTYAGLIMAGQMTRDEALKNLAEYTEETLPDKDFLPFLQNIGIPRDEFDKYVDMGPRYVQYRKQPSKAWKFAQKAKRKIFKILHVQKV